MFRVIDYSIENVEESMFFLAKEIDAASLSPSCIIGVLNGGKLPSELLATHFPDAAVLQYKLQRPGSGLLKKRILSGIKRMPKPVVNTLRSLEMTLSDAIRKKITVLADKNATLFFETQINLAQLSTDHPIILVDDAIDSGATVATLVESLVVAGVKRTHVKTAVIVHTLKQPLIEADFVRERGVLLRFPWSGDY